MKRVRITISPPDEYLPPVYRLLTREASYLSYVRIVNWNVADPPAGFLLWVRGDYRRLGRALEDGANVRDAELFPNGDDEAYCFLAADRSTPARLLFENFIRENVLTIPPIQCHDDGSSTFTLVGTDGAIQAAIEGVPEGVDVTVEAVGTGPVVEDTVVGTLSARQREAARVALAVGYFDTPRGATIEDVANELDCATSTAAEHLQKAESRVFSMLFEQ
ncbi:helix-turn-helix domain-containing protein [Natrialba sp. INN-245]|uniref:helix-turn-helix domain-containing protein n=1 Tax=Natrialba sp. INN-245 TaxID=2690967 RepID=UPI00130F9091|nr:helix-turn-helix domain-containing protein [Natrialba sp. INN-245]MWV40498.1 bacterio-opsin activator [Natrialba sp. INN-245]